MKKMVPVNMSNRHAHLTREHVEILFGKNHKLTVMKDLSQPGQFACEERIDVVGPKSTLKNIRILGPERPASQVEISIYDARTAGIEPMIRQSGNVVGTIGCKIVGPVGEVILDNGVIVASRHLHMHPKDSEKFGYKDKDIIKVRVGGDRSVIFENVLVRVHDTFALDMHIDIEEGNAAGIKGGEMAEILSNCD